MQTYVPSISHHNLFWGCPWMKKWVRRPQVVRSFHQYRSSYPFFLIFRCQINIIWSQIEGTYFLHAPLFFLSVYMIQLPVLHMYRALIILLHHQAIKDYIFSNFAGGECDPKLPICRQRGLDQLDCMIKEELGRFTCRMWCFR